MKNTKPVYSTLITLALCLVIVSPALAGPLEDGLQEYNRSHHTAALELWQPLAKQGDPAAQYWLGELYYRGHGVTKDYGQAQMWLEKAAAQGNGFALRRLGAMYEYGRGLAKNPVLASQYYQDAFPKIKGDAVQGDSWSQFLLGIMHYHGLGKNVDYAAALHWFRKSAEQQHSEAQNYMGAMYEDGKGVAKNSAEAVRWYRLSAEQGYIWGLKNMGFMCLNGLGTAQDTAAAMNWYGLAAEQQIGPVNITDRQQQKHLAMYEIISGRGGTKAENQARLVLEEANDRWPEHAGLLLAMIDLELSEGRVYEAMEYSVKLAQAYPDNRTYHIRLLKTYRRTHKTQEALELYRKLSAPPDLLEIDFYEAARELLKETGETEQLAQLWDRYALEYPDAVDLLAYRAAQLESANNLDESLVLYRKLLAAELPPLDRLSKYANLIRKLSGTVAAATELDAIVQKFTGQFNPQLLAPQATPSLPVFPEPSYQDIPPRLVAQIGHLGEINDIDLSPDGLMLTAGSDGAAILWDLESGKELRRFGHPGPVRTARFLPDRATLMTGADDGTIRVWQLATGTLLKEIQTPAGSVSALESTRDGSQLLSGGATKDLHLWDAKTGTSLASLSGHRASINSIALSPNDRYAATGSTDKHIIIWDLDKKRKITTLYGHKDSVAALLFTTDSRLLVSAGLDGSVRLWHLATGAEIGRYDLPAKALSLAQVPGDGTQVLVGTAGGVTILVNLETCSEVKQFAASSQEVRAVTLDKNRTLFAAGDSGIVESVAIDSDKAQMRFSGNISGKAPYLFSPQGNRFISGSRANGLWEWLADSGNARSIKGTAAADAWGLFRHDNTLDLKLDLPAAAVIKPFVGHFAVLTENGVTQLWSENNRDPVSITSPLVAWGEPVTLVGQEIWLVGSENGIGYLISDKTGEIEQSLVGHQGPIASVASSSDGHFGATGGFDKKVIIWDLKTGTDVQTLDDFDGVVVALEFVPGTHLLAAGGPQQPVRFWDLDRGTELPPLGDRSLNTESLLISPNGQTILTAGSLYGMRLWNLPGRSEARSDLSRGRANARDAVFSPDGKFLIYPRDDGGASLLATESGKDLARLITFVDDTWAVIDQEGRYDASFGGKIAGMHWVVGQIPIELAQLKERYYEPGLLAKLFGYNKDPLRDVQVFESPKPFPEVALSLAPDNQDQLIINLTNQGGGIGKVRVLVNGKEISSATRGEIPNPEAKETTLSIDLSNAALIPGEDNTIEVIAWNAEGYLSSRGKKISFWEPETKQVEPPELYAIIAGVSEYANPAMNLSFSGKDAADMAQALTISAERLFGVNKVHLALFTDYTNQQGGERIISLLPSRENLENAFIEARKAKPTDLLVVYLAGHGVMTAGSVADYHYLTRESRTTDLNELSDPAVRKQVSVSSTELTEWIKDIPALKQVMVLDTCAAGGAAVKLMAKRSLSSDQRRSLERLKDRTGFHILMGAAADKVSLEATQYGQGLLTYAILEGIKGAALNEGQFVDIQKLFQHAANRVPELARSLGGIQKPEIASPDGTSFDIGLVTAEDKERIPLARVKPLVLRSYFTTIARPFDKIGLTKLVNAELRDFSALGRGGKIVYVDADELPGAYTLSGRYSNSGPDVKVETYLFEGDQEIAVFEVVGPQSDLPTLARNLVAKATEEISRSTVENGKEKP